MDGVYKKIFSVVNARCAQSDRILQEKKLHIATISGEKLGLNMQFCCPQDVAVRWISLPYISIFLHISFVYLLRVINMFGKKQNTYGKCVSFVGARENT